MLSWLLLGGEDVVVGSWGEERVRRGKDPERKELENGFLWKGVILEKIVLCGRSGVVLVVPRISGGKAMWEVASGGKLIEIENWWNAAE